MASAYRGLVTGLKAILASYGGCPWLPKFDNNPLIATNFLTSCLSKPFEFATDVNSQEDIKAYLLVFMEDNGPEGFIRAISHVARAKGMTEVAEKPVLAGRVYTAL